MNILKVPLLQYNNNNITLLYELKKLKLRSRHEKATPNFCWVSCAVNTSAKRIRGARQCLKAAFLGTRLCTQSLQVFGFIRLFDKVRAELVRDILILL